jgi:hypothetical protein
MLEKESNKMSSGEEASGGFDNMSNASNPRIRGALEYRTAEERNVTVQPNQPRQPHNLQDLIRFSVEASTTGHSASDQNDTQFIAGPMDEEVIGFQ